MAIFHETAGSSCLQLELGEELAAPRPALRLATVGAGSGSHHPSRVGGTARMSAPAEFSHYIVPGTGGHGRARADALLAVAQVFSCRVAVFGYDATRHDKFLIMTGTRPVLDALDLMLPVIARQMEGVGRAAAGEYAKQVRAAMPQMPPSRRRSTLTVPYFRDYLRGFGSGAAEAIRELRSGIICAVGPELTRTLAAHDARAGEAFDREFPDTDPLRKENAEHRSAFGAGQDAGRAAGIEEEYAAQHDLVFAML